MARDVWKRYGGTQALASVDLELHAGEIHALLGGNGSGKSTLIKILSGVEPADRGEFAYRGEPVEPSEARRGSWLSVVHQQESTFASLTVAENLAAAGGFGARAAGPIHWRGLRKRAQAILDRFEIDAESTQPLAELGPASQKMVAIARALSRQPDDQAGVLILDEPTAALSAPEVEMLLRALRGYAASGWSILYVTHRLRELPGFADCTTVLQDGRVVETVHGSEITLDRLVSAVAGEVLDNAGASETNRLLAESDGLVVSHLTGGRLRDVSLSVRPGEIAGLVGLVGSGRSSLLRMIFGSQPSDSGDVQINGRPLKRSRPAHDKAVALIPEDRTKDAAFSMMTVNENLSAADVERYWSNGIFAHGRERRESAELVSNFSIKAASVDAPLSSLSGGNQQKVVLARWLRRAPRVLLLDEPTQGVDIRSRAEIHTLIRQAAATGAAVLIVSSELEEISVLCDCAWVMVGGLMMGAVEGADLAPANLVAFAQGARSPTGGNK